MKRLNKKAQSRSTMNSPIKDGLPQPSDDILDIQYFTKLIKEKNDDLPIKVGSKEFTIDHYKVTAYPFNSQVIDEGGQSSIQNSYNQKQQRWELDILDTNTNQRYQRVVIFPVGSSIDEEIEKFIINLVYN